jgi:small subunit ribosomal protein S22
MPPVVKQRLDLSVPLCQDPALQSHDTVKYVFTDITYGLNDRDRFIVIREPNGILRHANWQERDKMLQIYFPKPERELRKPRMFEGEYLQVSMLLKKSVIQFFTFTDIKKTF